MKRKTVLLVLLGLNGLSQLVSVAMMIAAPEQAADAMFGVTVTPDVVRILSIIGASVLSFLFLTVVTILWVLRDRREGCTVAILQGIMLAIIGPIMVATGTAAGGIDATKGLLIAVCGWWARQSLTDPSGMPRRA
jgi:hypothetical protein